MFAAIFLLLCGGGALTFAIWLTPYSNDDTTVFLISSYVIGAILILWGLWKLADELCLFCPTPKQQSTPAKKVATKPTPVADTKSKSTKAAVADVKTPLTKDLWKNCSYTIIASALLLVAIPIYSQVFGWILSWFMEPVSAMDHVHWAPLVINAFVLFFAATVVYSPDHDSPIFQKYYPELKTFAEVDSFLKKRLAETNYNKQRGLVFWISLPCYIGMTALCYLFSDYGLNLLFVSPVLLLSIFTATSNEIADSYITAKVDDEWRKNVCPHCGAIYSKFRLPTRTYDRKESKSVGSTTRTVTDKYTNGVDTIYVDRDETSYYVDTHTYETDEYVCDRCGKKHTERVYSSTRKYL